MSSGPAPPPTTASPTPPTDAVTCSSSKKVQPQPLPPSSGNDLDKCKATQHPVAPMLQVGGDVNEGGTVDKDTKSPPSKVDKKMEDERCSSSSSSGSSAADDMQLAAQMKPPSRQEASRSSSAYSKGDNTNQQQCDNAVVSPLKEHTPEQMAVKTVANSGTMVVTKNPPLSPMNKNKDGPTPKNNGANNTPTTTKESSATETPTTMKSASKKNGDAIVTEQKDGVSEKVVVPSSPSKKKKSKKKKKKRKTSNPENHPAQKPVESLDQNQKPAVVTHDTPMAKDEKFKGAESSSEKVAPTPATDAVPSKATKAAAAVPPKGKLTVNDKGKGEKTNGHPAEKTTKVSSRDTALTANAKKSEKEKAAGNNVADSTSKRDSAPETKAKEEAVEDSGAWETVEVKPRGRRGNKHNNNHQGNKKGGSSAGAQTAKASNSNSANNANSNNGRNNDHTNSGSSNNNHHHDGGNNGSGSHHGRRRKGRNRDKKNNGTGSQQQASSGNQQQTSSGNQQQASSGNQHPQNISGSANQQHTSKHNQQSNSTRSKMIKDVIFSILDAVDVEVALRRDAKSLEDGKHSGGGGRSNNPSDKRSTTALASSGSKTSNGQQQQQQNNGTDQRRKQSNAIAASASNSTLSKSVRDVLMGASAAANTHITQEQAKIPNNGAQPKSKGASGNIPTSSELKGPSKVKPGLSYKSAIEPAVATTAKPSLPHPKPPQTPKPKPNAWGKLPADVKPKVDLGGPAEKSSELHGSTNRPAAPPDQTSGNHDAPAFGTDDDGASPPLSTLHAPGNPCSASSSVASSLEAPHSSAQFRHPSSATACEDDVGYHLLNVCGQLSEEITTFMSRRALALDVRRKERKAVLTALGDTLVKIWPPGQCRVEMYGSCATKLDLPSSDLDLVVCGLDDIIVNQPLSPVNQQTMSNLHNASPNSFAEEEILQECVQMSPLSEHQMVESLARGAEQQEGSGVEQLLSTPDQLAGGSVVEEAVGPGMAVDKNAIGTIPGMEYSPTPSAVENYSTAEYESNEQDVASMEVTYSPGYSYHSQQDVVSADNYSQGYQGDDNMAMEGYGQEYQTNGQDYYYASPYSYVSPLSLNAQRVLRLASELELQPWAVQVKAIPTATVPVVKMLADPSKLPGSINGAAGGSWMIQQHIAAQAGVVAGAGTLPISSEQISPQNQQGSVSSSPPHFFSQHPMTPQWRGADIMNGLQPVDITFEGLEHGGILSTNFSAQVVRDACDETGLASESTPVVQVASVLKELLAQRRLNEPFSGGLSSYGLLLLLLAVLKDRKIIQEEMKKIEKQRQKVSGEANSRPSQSPGVESSDKGTASSSWASVAKKSKGSTARTDSLSTVSKSTNGSATTPTAKTGVNYSQVVQKECRENAKNNGWGGKDQISTKKQMAPTNGDATAQPSHETSDRLSLEKKQMLPHSSNVALTDGPAVLSQFTPSSGDDCNKLGSSTVPQGCNDVFEVLCSGKLTSGKLLMHFLLFYGQHFDARSTLIDINGTHHPEYGIANFDRLSPFVRRPPGGTMDPITGMFSVDQIVVYDPLEGANDHNVSKRCYCWNNVKWVFAQCYMTVSSVVETSDRTCTNKSSSQSKHDRDVSDACESSRREGNSGNNELEEKQGSNTADVMTPILELLLSF